MYKMIDNVLLDRDDICNGCLKYQECECDYVLHLKNITNDTNGRINIYGCDDYIGQEDDEEISF